MTSVDRAYCPTCNEIQLKSDLTRCAWCDTELVTPERTRSRRRKSTSKWTDLKVNQCYEAYLQGHSCNQIAGVIWETMGFASQNSCSNSLYAEFKAAGFPMRSQSAVTASRNFKHGRATRAGREVPGGEGEYRRWFKETHGRYNPPCRKDGCKHHAAGDSEWCWSHDPDRAEQRAELCAAMRAKGTQVFVPGENHYFAKLNSHDVAEIRARPDAPVKELAAEYDVSEATIVNVRKGKSWKCEPMPEAVSA